MDWAVFSWGGCMLQKLLWQEIQSQTRLLAGIFAASALACFAIILQAYGVAAIIQGAFLAERSVADLGFYFALLIAAAAVKAVASWTAEDLGGRLAVAVKTSLRQKILHHLLTVGPIAVPNQKTGELLHLLSEGMEGIDAYCSRYAPQFVFLLIIPPVILAVIFNLDLATTAILFITAPLIPLFMILIGRWANQLQTRQWKLFHFLGGHFLDVLSGLITLKAWGRSREQVEVIGKLSEKLRTTSLGVLRVAFLSALTLELLTTLGTAVVAVSVGLKLLFGQLEFQQAFFVLLLAPDFYQPFRQLGTHYHAGLAGVTAAEKIQVILNMAADTAKEFPVIQPKITAPPAIRFEAVSFSYPDAHNPALNSISFSVEAGDHVALVGPSGAGKSTIFDLLMKFIQPQTGEIFIDGHPLSATDPTAWRAAISYVPQFPHLFHGTVRDNICMDNAAHPERIEKAIALAGLEDLVRRLPAGYDTRIGEGGIGLSGGEARRVAIARAFFRNAPLLLMDEAMTSLDPLSEKLIQDSINDLQKNRTVLVIAHRPSTAQCADRILVLNKGSLVECGTPKTLLTNKAGLYHRLLPATSGELL
jgi:ATP-binding cassette subfamily C protein CydD